MDFIIKLFPYGNSNWIYTCISKLMKYVKLVPIRIIEGGLSAPELQQLFFFLIMLSIPLVSCGPYSMIQMHIL